MHKIKFLRGGNMKIIINELKTEAIIGCYDYERNQKQPLVINLELELGNWNYPDELIHTVNYAELCQLIRELTQASKFLLLESLAHYLVDELFTRYSQIKQIKINISKPDVCAAENCLIQVEYSQARAYKIALALGSNLNNPQHQLISAIEFLSEIVSEIKVAPFYKSSPQGFSEQDDFYNTCISGVTTLEPQELLIALKKIEKRMGKSEQFTNGPRIIDLDIILFDDQVVQGLFLQIPHPRMHERDFVLQPLAEIEPNWRHPKLQLSIKELLANLQPNQQFILQQVM